MGSERGQPAEQQALQALRLGQRRVALGIYRELLQQGIGDPALIHLKISMIEGLLGHREEENRHVGLAAEIAPSHPAVLLDYGSYLFRINQLEEARHAYEQVRGDAELESQAQGNLAAIAIQQHNGEQAEAHLGRALGLNPSNGHALELALGLLGEGIQEAAALERFVAAHQAADASLLFTLIGRRLDGAGQASAALHWLEKAIEADPANVSAQHQRARILGRVGRSDEAIEQLLVSLALEPDHIELMHTMGYCLQQINQLDSAIYFYERILAIETIHSEASNLLGCCYRVSGQEEQAIPVFTEALAHDPTNAKLLGNLASALRNVGRVDESLAISRRILALDPLSIEGFHSYMFTHSILPRSESAEVLAVAGGYWQAYRQSLLEQNAGWASLASGRQGPSPRPAGQGRAAGAGKIRVGILSAEIGAHVVGMFLRTFLQHYDRSALDVTLLIAHRRYELQENELVAMADGVLSLHGLGTFAAAQAISEQHFDVLLETSGYTNNTQLHLLSFRLAPVQCHYIGYHATTGLDTIDYLIGDAITTPAAFQGSFSETLWRLPDTWLAITYHEPLPAAESLAATDCFTFGSFNQGAKFNQRTFAYWAGALAAVPDSLLVIKDRSLTSDRRKAWIGASLEALGIPRSRLRFLTATPSWQDHMTIYNVVDACLDCTCWSGSTTVFDSLSMGTPYLAIEGDSMASRMSSSILTDYGYGHWIARSPSEYAELARRLADHQPGLRAGKPAMQARVQALSREKGERTTRQLEQALRQMLLAAAAGEPTKSAA